MPNIKANLVDVIQRKIYAAEVIFEDGIIQLFSFEPNQEVIVRWLP